MTRGVLLHCTAPGMRQTTAIRELLFAFCFDFLGLICVSRHFQCCAFHVFLRSVISFDIWTPSGRDRLVKAARNPRELPHYVKWVPEEE